VTTAMVAGTATGPFLLTLLGRMLGDDVRSGLVAFGVAAVPIALGAAFATRPSAPDA
jgi:urea transporter